MRDTDKEYGFKGKLNRYDCDTCGEFVITQDIDNGTTPFSMECKAGGTNQGCKGLMTSRFYNVPQNLATELIDYVWRKPTEEEYKSFNNGLKHHCDMGGLVIRPNGEGDYIPYEIKPTPKKSKKLKTNNYQYGFKKNKKKKRKAKKMARRVNR